MKEKFLNAYDEHGDALFRYAYFKIYNRELAKDLVQETFTKAWVYLSEGNEVTNLRAFLYRVLHNTLVDEVRKKKALSLDVLAEEGFEPVGQGKENIEAEASFKEAIAKLKTLPDDYQTALTLRFIEDMSVGEIAKVMRMNENAVSVRIHRGLKKLRGLIEGKNE